MITREQVADLQPGDVVELRSPEGAVVRGPLAARDALHGAQQGLTLGSGLNIRRVDGEPTWLWTENDWDLTVVSRAPRPLYVNHPRTEPHSGDVVRDADDDSDPTTWNYDDDGDWCQQHSRIGAKDMPERLRLLVDGETGQSVGPDLAEAWGEGFEAGTEHGAYVPGPSGRLPDPPANPYETGQVVGS